MTAAVAIRASAAILLLVVTGTGQNSAPPTIAQSGVVNLASHMPPRLPAGAIARGSLVSILGWRLGPVQEVHAAGPALAPTLAGVSVHINQGAIAMDALPLMVSFGEIHALLPENAPLGTVELRIVRDGLTSRTPARLVIVPSSFGAFSQNRRGWGRGDIRNSDGAINSPDHAAKPGETISLRGTGLGPEPVSIQVLVGNRDSQSVSVARHKNDTPGVDEINFAVPRDAPEGCYVPIRVRSGGYVSNTVTVAVNRAGEPCSTAGSWLGPQAGQPGRVAFFALVRVTLRLILTRRERADFLMDVGYATFELRRAGDQPNPFYVFPAPGTCATLAGPMTLRSLIRPESTLMRGTGTPLDAGDTVTIEGPSGERDLSRSHAAVLGGATPLPQAQLNRRPLFLKPGDYLFSISGGPDVAAFRTTVHVSAPIRWTNRDLIRIVDRARGVTVNWRAARRDGLVLITAINSDEESGGVGMCSCVERASAGNFHVPPEALANIPPTPAEPQGLPTNLLAVVELPGDGSSQTPGSAGLDRMVAFYASASATTVSYR